MGVLPQRLVVLWLQCGRVIVHGLSALLPLAVMMRPTPRVGDMYQTPSVRSSIRCKVYSAPPPMGTYIGTLGPEEFFGPVLEWQASDRFVSVRTEAGWINIWACRRAAGSGTLFAHIVGRDHRIAED